MTLLDLYSLTYPISFLIYLILVFFTWTNYLKSGEQYSFKDEYAEVMLIGLLLCLPYAREIVLITIVVVGLIMILIFWLNTIRKYFLLFYISRQKDPVIKETISKQAKRNRWI